MKKVFLLALGFLIAGGINWGIWGLFDEFNLIDYIVGSLWIDRVIYFLIGVSAIYCVIVWRTFAGKQKKEK